MDGEAFNDEGKNVVDKPLKHLKKEMVYEDDEAVAVSYLGVDKTNFKHIVIETEATETKKEFQISGLSSFDYHNLYNQRQNFHVHFLDNQVYAKKEKIDEYDEEVLLQYGLSYERIVNEEMQPMKEAFVDEEKRVEIAGQSNSHTCPQSLNTNASKTKHKRPSVETNKTNGRGKDLERKYKCPVCSKAFMWKIHFQAHEVTHRNERPHARDDGDKRFPQKSSEIRHDENVCHQRIQPNNPIEGKFHCQFCPKVFSSRGPLNVHHRTHTGERPHACQFCGMRFTQKISVQKHIMSKHIVEPQFKCKMCGKAFKAKYSLTLHEQLHTTLPVACEVCGKAFGHKSALKKHMAYMHAKLQSCAERSLKCHVCFKSFSSKSNVMRHERTHIKADNVVQW